MSKLFAQRLASATIVLSLLTLPSAASAERPQSVRERLSGTSLAWEILAPNAGFSVTVIGPEDYVMMRNYAAGAGELNLMEGGEALIDGYYSYELRVAPVIDAATADALRKARAADDQKAIRDLRRAGRIPATPLLHSATFVVRGGEIVPRSDAEEDAQKRDGAAAAASASILRITPTDVVTPDDSIVQGSLCVGFDCVDGESFGFDTLRLKENNTRIKFEDTSVGTYPGRDWQLTANDSASGGAEKFSVEDVTGASVPLTVTGGAPTNSFFMASNGKLGFRTAAPVLDLHASTTDTPALRLEQTNAGGFTAQTWDVAGNEANFFIRDVTGGSLLSFRIRPGAPTSSIDIARSGNVGFGTSSPVAKIHASGSDGVTKALIEETNATSATRTLLELKNTGRAAVALSDSTGTASYTMTGPATAENVLSINNSEDAAATRVVIGGSAATTYTLDIQGTLRVTGNVTSASTKAGIIEAAEFSGGVASVTFASPFPDTNYAIALTAVTSDGSRVPLSAMSKTATGFIVRGVPATSSGASPLPGGSTSPLLEVNWTATVLTD